MYSQETGKINDVSVNSPVRLQAAVLCLKRKLKSHECLIRQMLISDMPPPDDTVLAQLQALKGPLICRA